MSRREVLDPHSGAILFKRDEEELALEEKVKKLEEEVSRLSLVVKKLEKLLSDKKSSS